MRHEYLINICNINISGLH